jgi:secondary thiamine-phosphate synthase enzyme
MPFQTTLEVRTPGRGTLEITAAVDRALADARTPTGLCHVFVQHTSASLLLTENADPDVRSDLETLLARLAPDGDPAWRHDAEGPDDMAAHARAMLTTSALVLPVAEGRLALGTWQGLYLYEHRAAPQRRRIVVTVLGG